MSMLDKVSFDSYKDFARKYYHLYDESEYICYPLTAVSCYLSTLMVWSSDKRVKEACESLISVLDYDDDEDELGNVKELHKSIHVDILMELQVSKDWCERMNINIVNSFIDK